MAPLPEIPNTYRCTLEWNALDGVTPRNVIHVYSDTGDGEDVFNTLESNLTDAMFTPMSTAAVLTSIAVLPLDTNSATQIYTLSSSINGAGTAAIVPAVAAVVSLRTSQRGSRGRGRVFLGPVTEDQVASGTINNQGTITEAWSTFRSAMATDERPLVVASYTHADQHTVVTASCDLVAGTQRRRQDQLRV